MSETFKGFLLSDSSEVSYDGQVKSMPLSMEMVESYIDSVVVFTGEFLEFAE